MATNIKNLIIEFLSGVDNKKFRELISNELKNTNGDEIKLANLSFFIIRNVDFFEMAASFDDIKNNLLNELSVIAVKIINASNQGLSPSNTQVCGLHEEKACVLFKRQPPLLSAEQRSHKDWPSLPIWADLCFETIPGPQRFKEIKFFRIIDLISEIRGHWWFVDFYPTSRPHWRHCLAVLMAWNEGTHYVEFSPRDELKVWGGRAVWQPVPKEICFLPGMGHQVWIDPAHLPEEELVRKKINWDNPPFCP